MLFIFILYFGNSSMSLQADEPEYMVAGLYFDAINMKKHSSQSCINGKLHNIPNSVHIQNLNAALIDTGYLFLKTCFCSNNIIDYFCQSWSNSILQILTLVNLGVRLCCEIFTDYPHYWGMFSTLHEENVKQTVLTVTMQKVLCTGICQLTLKPQNQLHD